MRSCSPDRDRSVRPDSVALVGASDYWAGLTHARRSALTDALAAGATTDHDALVVDRCAQCEWPMDMHDRDVRFVLPDRIADWDAVEHESRTEGNETFLNVDSDQFYMRVILPVQLTDGHLVAFGVWLEVDDETIEAAFEVWDSAGYAGFTCSGRLANDLPPWPGSTLGARVEAEVRHQAELPYIVRSADLAVQHILDATWEHATVLNRLAAIR